MKKKIISIFIALLLIITAIPLSVFAGSDTPEVKASGTNANFAKDALIGTVRIDNTKISRDNVTLFHPDYSVGFRIDDNGKIYAPRCGVKSGYTGLGYFTLTFADAAIMPDGTRKNFVVKFADVHTIGKSGTENYYDYLEFAQVTNNVNMPLVYSPLSVEKQKHVAIRSAVTFSVAGAGENDTFLFSTDGIDTNRAGNANFEAIVDAAGHYAYSESMEPLSGIAAGSDMYVTENSTLQVVEGKTAGSYGTRFVGNGYSDATFANGFATVALAKNGFTSRVWSSAGTNSSPLTISFFAPMNAYSLETAAGENGSISLWADGTANSTDAAKLDGGTTATPLSYSVPGGKSITLAITPDDSYELNTLSLNGQTAQPTRTTYQSDGNVSYELDLSEISADTCVNATFKKAHIHDFTYTNRTDIFGIDVTCAAENCPLTENKITVSAGITDTFEYGKVYYSNLQLVGADTLADTTHDALTAVLTFKSSGENPVEYSTFPSEFGEYTAIITITDARDANNVQTYSVSKPFTYQKADILPGIIIENRTYGEEPVLPRLALSTNPEYARTVYYYKPLDADDSAYTTDIPVNAGKYIVKAVRPETAHYKEGVATAGFQIYQAASNPVTPTGITAVYGTKLSEVTLPDNWAWDTPEQYVGSVGNNTFSVTYTPDDAINYTTVQADVSVNVTKRPITVTAEDKSSYQGFALESLTYSVSGGVLEGDDLAVTLGTNADSAIIDTYEINVTANNPNYDITPVGGTYTVTAAPEYTFFGSSEISWTKGSDENAELTVICSVDNDLVFGKFTAVKMDGEIVNPDNYIAASGSLILSFKAEYLSTLAVGQHIVSVSLADGNAEGIINILAAAPAEDDTTTPAEDTRENTTIGDTASEDANETNEPASGSITTPTTGDSAAMYALVLIVSAFVLLAAVFFRKRLHQ